MRAEDFIRNAYKRNNWSKDDILSPPTYPQEGLNILIDHFLGEDWYSVTNISNSQVNTEAICEILKKYPKVKDYGLFEWFKRKIGLW